MAAQGVRTAEAHLRMSSAIIIVRIADLDLGVAVRAREAHPPIGIEFMWGAPLRVRLSLIFSLTRHASRAP